MATLINLITKKPDWEKKIANPKIVQKWKNELLNQNVNPEVLERTLDLLRIYNTNVAGKETYYEDDPYEWSVSNIKLMAEDLGMDKCNCKCAVCEENENIYNSNYSDSYYDTEGLEELEANRIKYKNIKCKCKPLKEKRKTKFLSNHIKFFSGLLSNEEKLKFLKYVSILENNTPVDYHPGSNNQVIDIVHPSLYCYVKGVSLYDKNIIEIHDDILFQWLPAEFTVNKNEGSVTSVSIDSYINNLDRTQHPELYESIEEIFGNFVPHFESVLEKLFIAKKINKVKKLDKCQVIVKIANIILTPDNPKYSGGSWHLEGLPSEKIIATGIYYYDITNISDSFLSFRGTIDVHKFPYPQNCNIYVENHYGLKSVTDENSDGNETIMELGRVKTIQDSYIVFSNFLQHKISEFELVDPTKNGSRKILVFFLIDPDQRILSTADVPQQQGIMSLDNARHFRELLMFQRKYEISAQNSFYERGWSLCEH